MCIDLYTTQKIVIQSLWTNNRSHITITMVLKKDDFKTQWNHSYFFFFQTNMKNHMMFQKSQTIFYI